MKKYRKKPVVVEAVQWTGQRDISDFVPLEKLGRRNGQLTIITLEGEMTVSYGDYIIKGIAGEFYPCKPDIFMRTYEPVEDKTVCIGGDLR